MQTSAEFYARLQCKPCTLGSIRVCYMQHMRGRPLLQKILRQTTETKDPHTVTVQVWMPGMPAYANTAICVRFNPAVPFCVWPAMSSLALHTLQPVRTFQRALDRLAKPCGATSAQCEIAVQLPHLSALLTSGLASWPRAVKMSVRVTMPTSFAWASTMGMRCTCQ